MDLRSLINKLDSIEQQRLLSEAEELMEKVGLRLADFTDAVRGISDDDKRAEAIGKIARDYGYSGLFDPLTGKFVNDDGKFAWFGSYEAEVKRLASKGLIPDAAKTTAVLGLMGQDEKIAKPASQQAEKLYKQIDRADELIKKALETPAVPASENIAESLIKLFGIDTTILEAITPQEHQLIKQTRKDIEPLLKQADGDAVEYKANYDNYIRVRNELIAKIKALIEAIKKLGSSTSKTTTDAGTSGTRSGGSISPTQESISSSNKKIICELRATQKGVTIYQPDKSGYLSPEQVKHNIEMLKTGKAELDWTDHVGANMQDFANMATFGFADKAAAYLDSLKRGSSGYEAELEKYRSGTQAYASNKNAGNLRNAVKSITGYEMDADNPFGNATPGDIAGLLVGGAGLWNAGVKGATKLGGGKIAQNLGGLTTGVVGPVAASATIGEPTKVAAKKAFEAAQQPIPFDSNVLAFQNEVLKTDKNAFPRFGADGKLGNEVKAAIAKYPQIAQKYGLQAQTQAAQTQTAQAQTASNTVPSDSFSLQALQSALSKAGVTGNQITPDQLLAVADTLGITELSESSDLDRIISLSGLNEINASPGALSTGAKWFKGLFGKGADDAAKAIPATADDAAKAVPAASTKAGEELTGNVVRKDGITWTQRQDGIWQATSKDGKTLLKPNDEMQMILGKTDGRMSPGGVRPRTAVDNPQNIAAQRTAKAVDDMARAGQASRTTQAATAAADDVAKLAATPNSAEAAKGWAYKLGLLGGRFARLVKNNKFLTLLAALAGLGIYLYNKNDSGVTQPAGPTSPTQTQPAGPSAEERRREEERKRQLGELNDLIKRLFGGWPTDPETAQAIKDAVAIGATAPEGFKAGEVSTQPASSGRWVDPIAAASAKTTQDMIASGDLPPSMAPRGAQARAAGIETEK